MSAQPHIPLGTIDDVMSTVVANLRADPTARHLPPPTPGYVAQEPPTQRCWEEFERRKSALPVMSSDDYDDAIRVILLEIGL